MVRVLFGQPEHGWLPLTLSVDTFTLALDVSDVPTNPVEELCDCLTLVLQGMEASVWWHLEPTWYRFHFEPTPREVLFSIGKSASARGAATNVLQHTGNVESIVLPFYRAFKQFTSRAIAEEHWPTVDQEKVNRLTDVVRARKPITKGE
ncbi:hypothetical protein DNI29_22010 [Hymenobacter sediminis]|uniref:hypothetical protein n=1 Tax=Hymenobacter sediminis TaxID=2218621 RepID=UPI000DA69339|nr:hypothetical protein [Hymenobacter sediminis]RPD44381.1 hypothetical protein DNI29_22010 [Hymenobacter sediminis]